MKTQKRALNKKIAGGLIAAILSFNVHASGIPVVDLVSITEQVRSYVQQIADYQVYLDQLNIQDNQYVQMVQDYRQTITEYNHLLNQIRALDLSVAQQEILDQVVSATYGNQAIGLVATIDPASASASADTDLILQNEGYIPRSQADIVSDYDDLDSTSTSGIVRQRQRLAEEAVAYQNQMNMVQSNESVLNRVLQSKIDFAKAKRRSLGPESDLATAQHMAEQQGIMMEQFQVVSKVLNQQLMVYESPTQARNRSKIEAMEAELSRLQRVAARRDAEVPQATITGYGVLIP
mgnify:CR=1 FL=1